MSKKIVLYISLFIALFVWLEGYSPIVYRFWAIRELFYDDYRHGDLYRLCYLPNFKEKAIKCNDLHPQNVATKTNIYLIGDSFTEEGRVNKEDVASTTYTYVHWGNEKNIQLDTSAKNILIIESVERNVKEHFISNTPKAFFVSPDKMPIVGSPSFYQQLEEWITTLIPKGIEERLERVLFNYDWILWIRELKATLNLTYFNRVEDKVVLSPEKDALFYFEEADSTQEKSSFYPVKQAEVDSMVVHINQTSTQYKDAGFDEVYLSIIPNKVSVISPNMGKYNHVIERIQTDSSLKVPLIDTYKHFKNSGKRYYLTSDTHWNCEGRDVWLKEVNGLLKK